MTMLANLGPRLGSLFLQRGVQVIAAGLLSGAVGGSALVASGVIPVGGTRLTPTLALMACPGSGPVLAHVSHGQALLVTAHSADGAWYEVYVGQPGVDRAWAPADALKLQSPADGLPAADCAATSTPGPLGTPTPVITAIVSTPSPGPSASPSPAASTSPTSAPTVTAKPTPTPKVTPKPTVPVTPPPTPAPTATPVNNPPALSGLYAYPTCIGPDSSFARVYVTATDPDGDNLTVRIHLHWIDTNGNSWSRLPQAMSAAGGNVWTYDITYASISWAGAGSGYIHYDVTAYDSHGLASATLHDDPAGDPAINFVVRQPDGCVIL
jgi:hypothetical protein